MDKQYFVNQVYNDIKNNCVKLSDTNINFIYSVIYGRGVGTTQAINKFIVHNKDLSVLLLHHRNDHNYKELKNYYNCDNLMLMSNKKSLLGKKPDIDYIIIDNYELYRDMYYDIRDVLILKDPRIAVVDFYYFIYINKLMSDVEFFCNKNKAVI